MISRKGDSSTVELSIVLDSPRPTQEEKIENKDVPVEIKKECCQCSAKTKKRLTFIKEDILGLQDINPQPKTGCQSFQNKVVTLAQVSLSSYFAHSAYVSASNPYLGVLFAIGAFIGVQKPTGAVIKVVGIADHQAQSLDDVRKELKGTKDNHEKTNTELKEIKIELKQAKEKVENYQKENQKTFQAQSTDLKDFHEVVCKQTKTTHEMIRKFADDYEKFKLDTIDFKHQVDQDFETVQQLFDEMETKEEPSNKTTQNTNGKGPKKKGFYRSVAARLFDVQRRSSSMSEQQPLLTPKTFSPA